jgi:DNA processing protein
MDTNFERLLLAVAAFDAFGTHSRTRAVIRREGIDGLQRLLADYSSEDRQRVERVAAQLAEQDHDAVILGDPRYPTQLAHPAGPGVLFVHGNLDLLRAPAVGMCGSRKASDHGLRAALACGEEVASRNLAIVSGYAKGVDTQTHLAALRSGGCTIIVLAEGILHFRKKRAFTETGLPADRVLVMSQFSPSQPWTVGGAMTRNGIIAGLAIALVVIEAGETGGTFNAGLQALDLGRPVLALDFTSSPTPRGNQRLFERGALPIRSRKELGRCVADVVARNKTTLNRQLPLL